MLLIAGRGYVALGDFTYFFVAGTDFVDPAATPVSVWVQNGQGYDGQFFYRYALNPFDFSKSGNGITVDHVPYRIQRIVYPLLSWIFSFGGIPWLVPYSLILVNMLAFFGIIYFTITFIKRLPEVTIPYYMPLLLCGLYMSLARDLSEVTELFFFIGALYYLFQKSYWRFVVFASLTMLTRETSIVALAPIIIISIYVNYKNKSFLSEMWVLLLPFVFFAGWKLFIAINTVALPESNGFGNIGFPLLGIVNGFIGNLDISTVKNKLQLVFWLLYFFWQVALTTLVLKTLIKHKFQSNELFFAAIAGAYLSWLVFSIFLSHSIYIDDWSFVRVFSLWNMIGILILIFRNRPFPVFFRYYSVILVFLTLVRLIVRP